MRKITLILFFLILVTGCSIFRKTNESGKATDRAEGTLLTDELESQNLTNENFFIQKAEIKVTSDEMNQKFIASIKFVAPDKYLISVRNITGIEAARIFISSDTVLINDRINRKLFHGKPEFLKMKYDISYDIFPVIFGDYVSEKQEDEENCIDGIVNLTEVIKGLRLDYSVDCRKVKIIGTGQRSSSNSPAIEITYNDFIKVGGIITSSRIRIKHFKSLMDIDIKIGKIERPWNGSIEFIPGSRYELIELQ